MSLLTPLGFLGLIGIIILIIIYIIKPNYQQKIISSTYIWKLSLKYKKKRIPINKLRNILIFICQVLIITACSFILAQPIIKAIEDKSYRDQVVIIDASASMLAEVGGETRFERAVERVRELAKETVENDAEITIIIARETASFLIQGADISKQQEIEQLLDELVDGNEMQCTYGSSDIEGAIELAEEITSEKERVDVLLYTGLGFYNKGKVQVKYVGLDDEWNASIVDARAVMVENYYRFEIDIACYGDENRAVTFDLIVNNPNEEEDQISETRTVQCIANELQTIVFEHKNSESLEEVDNPIDVWAFESVEISLVGIKDSFEYDDKFYLFGGQKQKLKVQYTSSAPNNFFSGVLNTLTKLQNKWEFEVDDVPLVVDKGVIMNNKKPALEGYDFYIFEHTMPEMVPMDGIVLIVNPDVELPGADFSVGSPVGSSQPVSLAEEEEHPLMQYIDPSQIQITRYVPTNADGYTSLMSCNGDPVVQVKDLDDTKIVLFSFSLNYSNLPVIIEFPIFFNNMFEYFIPETINKSAFEISEMVTINARAPEISLVNPENKATVYRKEQLPAEVKVVEPGVYTLSQTLLSGLEVEESFYVRIPKKEFNIFRMEDNLKNPYFIEYDNRKDIDLMTYFAAALVAILFVEWLLQLREHF